MARHREMLQVVLSPGKLSLYKCTWRDLRFGQSRADLGEESVFYLNVLNKEN